MAVHEDDVIELVDRLEAEDERRIAVLLERRRGEQRGLQAVRAAVADDAAEAALRRAAVRLFVVRKTVQELLNGERRPETRDEPTFRGGERGWDLRFGIWDCRDLLFCDLFVKSRIPNPESLREGSRGPERVSSRCRYSSSLACRLYR